MSNSILGSAAVAGLTFFNNVTATPAPSSTSEPQPYAGWPDWAHWTLIAGVGTVAAICVAMVCCAVYKACTEDKQSDEIRRLLKTGPRYV